jgi:hypothetical protein
VLVVHTMYANFGRVGPSSRWRTGLPRDRSRGAGARNDASARHRSRPGRPGAAGARSTPGRGRLLECARAREVGWDRAGRSSSRPHGGPGCARAGSWAFPSRSKRSGRCTSPTRAASSWTSATGRPFAAPSTPSDPARGERVLGPADGSGP